MENARDTLEALLARVEKPGRYIGRELNAIIKDLSQVDLLWALAFPDLYDLGMSNLGLRILYYVLNSHPQIACERVFAPWADLETLLREQEYPLFTLENQVPVRRVDILAFTLPYEIILSNVVNMIELGGLPLLAKDRDHTHPLLLGGGSLTLNPEPMADFFDAFVVGDGEEVVLEISQAVIAWKKTKSADKKALLEALAHIEGVYVPAFFRPVYDSEGRLETMRSLTPGGNRVRRRVVSDLDQAPFPNAPIVPNLITVHDRMVFELARGCTAGCRFCQAGMITRPTRERSPVNLLRQIDEVLANTGVDGISLNSLSAGDYSCINTLLTSINGRFSSKMVSTSISSLQVRTLTPELTRATVAVKRATYTIAPEAGSQRLRETINKDVSEEQLMQTVETVFKFGGQGIKLYFMCGLPGETDEDLASIVDLAVKAREVARAHHHRPAISVSVSTFVPKPFTPFQWASQIDLEEIRRRQTLLRRLFKPHKHIRLKTHYGYGTFLEGVFSRGDRRLGGLLLAAHRLGCRFDGWSEQIRPGWWEQAFEQIGINPADYLRERSLDEVLPWDHIDGRVSKKFLKEEWARHKRGQGTPDCRWGDCGHCGACDQENKLTTFDGQDPLGGETRAPAEGRMYRHPIVPMPEPIEIVESNPVVRQGSLPWRKVRLQYEKVGDARFVGHLELVQIFHRALRRIGAPLRYSQGFHPSPRIIFSNPLSVGIESQCEFVDIELVETENPLPPKQIVSRLNENQLPGGIRILDVASSDFPINGMASITFLLRLPEDVSASRLEAAVGDFLAEGPRYFQKKSKEIDVRPLIRRLEAEGRTLRMELETPSSGTVKPTEVLSLLMPEVDRANVHIVKESCRFETSS